MIKKTIIFSISSIVIFIFGIFIGMTSTGDELKSFSPQLKNYVSNLQENDTKFVPSITNQITFKNQSEISERKSLLINFIWNSETIPLKFPDLIETNYQDSRFNDIRNLKQIDKISIFMENGLNSYSYLFHPEQSNGKLIIYHQGHSGGFINGKNTIDKFVNSGYFVAAFSMPLIGLNNQPVVQLENLGNVKFFNHNQFVLLDSDDFSSMTYFFSPVNITLNHIDKNFSFDEYYMIGISGGGWVTTVYSGIDDRIMKSFSVADSLPFSLRTTADDVGDYEQFNPKFYSIANYLELYVMSAFGENQKHVQILNQYDPCCFSGNHADSYTDLINQFLSLYGPGNFELIIDDTHSEHKISDYAIVQILHNIS